MLQFQGGLPAGTALPPPTPFDQFFGFSFLYFLCLSLIALVLSNRLGRSGIAQIAGSEYEFMRA